MYIFVYKKKREQTNNIARQYVLFFFVFQLSVYQITNISKVHDSGMKLKAIEKKEYYIQIISTFVMHNYYQ